MINSGVIVQSSRIPGTNGHKQILKNGSSVLVRVIDSKGDGKYTGSIAGVRVNLTGKNLSVGSSFVAEISEKNGIITVTPKQKENVTVENVQINPAQTEKLISILQSLGLPPNNHALNIIQQFKQMGLKLDQKLLLKNYNLSLKIKGKEKSASEIISILQEKGIDFTEEELLQLLNLLENKEEENHKNQKNDFDLLNKINQTEGKWYILPFELKQNLDGTVLGRGNIRFLLDSSKKLKLLNFECVYEKKCYLFRLEFENKKLVSVGCNVSLQKEEYILPGVSKSFIKMGFQNVPVYWGDADILQGSGCALENVIDVQGVV